MNEVTREKLSADFKAVIGDVDELVKTTSRQTGEKIADLRQRLEKKLKDGRKALSEQGPLRAKVEEARASAQSYLREKRWPALAIAAGVGLALGLILGRRD